MELTKREAALLAAARKNPASLEWSATVVLICAVVALGGAILFELLDGRPFEADRLIIIAAFWVVVAVLGRDYRRLEATAHSLIAKLDGSYRDAVSVPPQTLGLTRSDDRA